MMPAGRLKRSLGPPNSVQAYSVRGTRIRKSVAPSSGQNKCPEPVQFNSGARVLYGSEKVSQKDCILLPIAIREGTISDQQPASRLSDVPYKAGASGRGAMRPPSGSFVLLVAVGVDRSREFLSRSISRITLLRRLIRLYAASACLRVSAWLALLGKGITGIR